MHTVSDQHKLLPHKHPNEDLKAIIEGAMRAPNAGNMTMYSMIIVSDQAIKQRLSETCDHQLFIAKRRLDKIVVYEQKGEGLDIEVVWNTPFLVVSE